MTEPEQTDHTEGMEADGNPALDALVEASRACRRTVMDDNKKELTEAQVAEICERTTTFLDEQKGCSRSERITIRKLSDMIGESKGGSTLRLILLGQYSSATGTRRKRRDVMLAKLDKQLGVLQAKRESPARSGFVWARYALDMRACADVTVNLNSLGAIWGPSAMGKTLACEAIAYEYPGTTLLTVDDECFSPLTFGRRLCHELRLGDYGTRRGAYEALRIALGESRKLTIIDEVHLAGLDTLNSIRQLHDAAKSPFLLVGLPSLQRRLLEGRDDDSRGSTVFSRIRPKLDLTERCRQGDRGEPLWNAADIRKVFRRNAVRLATDGLQWLQQLACMPEHGGIRAAANLVQLATLIAQKKNLAEITLDLLLQTSRLLEGIEGAKQIGNRIAQRAKVA